MSFAEATELASPTGAALCLRHEPAEGEPRAILLINHGLAEHSGRYERFACFMAARGLHVYAHDHRGHGHTKALDAPLGSFGKGKAPDKVIADVAAVHDHAETKHPGLPVIVFGHSMGGPIALNHVLRHSGRVHAAAIWNASLRAGFTGRTARAILAWERFRLGSDVPSRILPKLTFEAWAKEIPDRRTEFDWLSRDEEEVDRYIADPLCGWNASVGLWQGIFDFAFFGADDGNFKPVRRDMPFNIVGGEKDPATGGGASITALATRMRAMGFSNLNSKVYAETRHESLNEINRDRIMADFAKWVENALS